ARPGGRGAGGGPSLRPGLRLVAGRGPGGRRAGRPARSQCLPRAGGVTVTAAHPAVDTPPLLELDGVSAGYASFRALFDVSFSVRPQTALALLGSNGSGKTTVARVCSGLLRRSAGHVRFD